MLDMIRGSLAVMATVVFALAVLASPADAQEEGGGLKWRVAIGAGATPDYEGSDDYEVLPAILGKVAWENGRFVETMGEPGSGRSYRLRGNIVRSKNWVFGPVAAVRGGRRNCEDNRVDNLPSIQNAFEWGGFGGYRTGNLGLEVTGVAATAATTSVIVGSVPNGMATKPGGLLPNHLPQLSL